MSFDLKLLRCRPGEDMDAAVQAVIEYDEKVACEEEAEVPTMVEVLGASDAKRMESTLRSMFATIEPGTGILNSTCFDDPESGLQVSMYDAWIDITFPYHTRLTSSDFLGRLASTLEQMQRDMRLAVYDPQADRCWDLSSDREQFLRSVRDSMDEASAVLSRPAADGRKPWWRFW